jgi:hypothetical protein
MDLNNAVIEKLLKSLRRYVVTWKEQLGAGPLPTDGCG